MAKFEFVLSTTGGRREEGVLIASTKEAALQKLRQTNKIIISCNESCKKKMTFFWEKPHLSFEDKLMFTKHLHAMIKAGIVITEALQIFIDQTKNKNSREMFETILNMIKSGQTLAKSLANYKDVFSDVYVNMLAAGEESGTLEDTLEYLEIQMEKDYDLRKKLKGALIYPAVIMSITLIMALGIVVFIMPKVTKIFSTFKMKLPFITQMLIDFGDLMTNKYYIAIPGFIAFIIALIFILKLKPVKKFFGRVGLKMPVVGKILIKTNLALFARTLSSLLKSGIAMSKALDIVYSTMSNDLYKNAILDAKQRVEQGGTLADSFEKYPKLFPTLMVKILMVGERTGSLENSTEHMAEMYEKDVDNITKNLSTLLEPILLVFMAMIVGGLALAIITPIYQLPNMIHK